MPSEDESMVLLCEWPLAMYVPRDLPRGEASALVEEAESRLALYATELEEALRRRLPSLRIEVG